MVQQMQKAVVVMFLVGVVVVVMMGHGMVHPSASLLKMVQTGPEQKDCKSKRKNDRNDIILRKWAGPVNEGQEVFLQKAGKGKDSYNL